MKIHRRKLRGVQLELKEIETAIGGTTVLV